MTDRELLEYAAKAAGVDRWCGEDWAVNWNPLTDDGDALRLAVKLGLLGSPSLQIEWIGALGDTDPYAATRRAIVRAAAEIGKEMK